MRILRPFFRCTVGAAAAEMVLVLPFLVLLLFGGMELGTYFYYEHQVVKGVRDGARYAGRQAFSSINCPTAGMPAGVLANIQEVTRTGRLTGGTARVPGWVNADITVSVECAPITTGIYKNEAGAPRVRVRASVAYRSLFDGVGVLDDTFRLRAEQQASVMGI